MTAEEMRGLFDPFHSTKDNETHLGLGLFVSHEIVRQHGGDLLVESQPDVGATGNVVLRWSAAGHVGGIGMNGTSILVVDDERGFQDSIAWCLRADGHDVRTAPDGEEAMEIHGGPRTFDVVITTSSCPE